MYMVNVVEHDKDIAFSSGNRFAESLDVDTDDRGLDLGEVPRRQWSICSVAACSDRRTLF